MSRGEHDKRAPLGERVRRVYHQVFGVPDYAAYAEHMRTRHPGAPVLSAREFCARAIDRKYAKKGPRCC